MNTRNLIPYFLIVSLVGVVTPSQQAFAREGTEGERERLHEQYHEEQELEEVRVPATLLYGSDTIGDVVKVRTNRVPLQATEGLTGRVIVRGDIAEYETRTPGYDDLSFDISYRLPLSTDAGMDIFLRGRNMRDEQIRNHSSSLKDRAPQAGRNFILGLRVSF